MRNWEIKDLDVLADAMRVCNELASAGLVDPVKTTEAVLALSEVLGVAGGGITAWYAPKQVTMKVAEVTVYPTECDTASDVDFI